MSEERSLECGSSSSMILVNLMNDLTSESLLAVVFSKFLAERSSKGLDTSIGQYDASS